MFGTRSRPSRQSWLKPAQVRIVLVKSSRSKAQAKKDRFNCRKEEPFYTFPSYSEHAPIRFRVWGTAPQRILKLRRSGVPKFLICAFFFFF